MKKTATTTATAIPNDFCEYDFNELITPTHTIEYYDEGEEYEYDEDSEDEVFVGYAQEVRVIVGDKIYKQQYIQDPDDFCKYTFHDEYVKLCKRANIEPLPLEPLC